jgi:glycosyltransferase involved in cell wall biosynthesis
MNIGVDARELRKNHITGTGRLLIQFISHATLKRPGHRFILYGDRDTFVNLERENIELKKFGARSSIFFDQILLPLLIKKDNLDIFFSPYIKCPFLSSAPVVITIHDLTELAFEDYRRRMKNRLYKFLFKASALKASHIMTVSEYSKKEIVEILKVDPAKITVNHNSIERAFALPKKTEISRVRELFNIHNDYILYVGNFNPHKNVGGLVRAYGMLPPDIKGNYSLVLCGKRDEYASQLEREIQKTGLEEKVIFTDFVDDELLPALYKGSSLFVLPSLYEGFGYPVLEAMHFGVPVVASDRTSIPEVVGDAGVLVDCRNPDALSSAINRVLLDENLREDLKRRGLERSRTFTIEKNVDTLLCLMERLT